MWSEIRDIVGKGQWELSTVDDVLQIRRVELVYVETLRGNKRREREGGTVPLIGRGKSETFLNRGFETRITLSF